jgi:hypothetical protein
LELKDETIKQLKAKHGENLVVFPAEAGTLVFRKPTLAEFNRFIDESDAKEVTRSVALRNEAGACFVFPEAADGKPDRAFFERALDLEPAIPLMVVDSLNEMAGVTAERRAKALKKL